MAHHRLCILPLGLGLRSQHHNPDRRVGQWKLQRSGAQRHALFRTYRLDGGDALDPHLRGGCVVEAHRVRLAHSRCENAELKTPPRAMRTPRCTHSGNKSGSAEWSIRL